MSPSSSDSSSSSRGPRAASPWAHVVRGESESVPTAPWSPPSAAATVTSPEPCDRDVAGSSEGSENNGNGKKSAWSKPSNGVIEVGPVMGAVSWPALGESSKAAPKVSPSELIKTGDRFSVSAPQAPVPVVANHQTKAANNPNQYSHRQKSIRRGGGNHGLQQPNGGVVSSPLPPAPVEITIPILPEKSAGQGQEASKDMHNNRNSNWDHAPSSRGSGFSPHSHGGSDHHRPFNRRGNNGGGGGPHNGGGRHDPDRGGYANDWNNPPARHMAPPPPPRGHHPLPQYLRPPPPPRPAPAGAAAFSGLSSPVRPFVGHPMGFPEIPPPIFYVQASPPFVAAHPVAHAMPPAMLLNAAEYQRATVLKQIEYYFSNDNLCKDTFLRKHMDEQGWVPVTLIAGFNRVKQFTNHIPNTINYILDTLRTSELVEVQGEMLRRRGDWTLWVLNSQPSQHGSTPGPSSPAVPNVDSLADRLQSVVLEERTGNHSTGGSTVSGVVGRSAFGDFTNQSRVGESSKDRHGRLAGHAGQS